mgnify:CR=1 FL=1
MRAFYIFWVCIFVGVGAYGHDGGHDRPGPQPEALLLSRTDVPIGFPLREVVLRLVDEATGAALDGLIRVRDGRGKLVGVPKLLSRTAGLSERSMGPAAFSHMDSWSVLSGVQVLSLPKEPLMVEAFNGLEWAVASAELAPSTTSLSIPLKRIYNREEAGYVSGNVHLHLQRMSPRAAEQYATEVARADGCDVVFLSYLERTGADENYTSNRFTREDLARFSSESGVLFGWGEEYRHNFPKQPGYGHVMFLDIQDLVLPASFGADIMKVGNDDGVLRTGIEVARAQGATTLWCHNTRGLEDIPSWLHGIIDGHTIFDEGSTGSYAAGPYRYLNVGLKVPFATGTDWFIKDMAMTYVAVDGPVSTKSWLAALRDGKSFISNGPLLSLTVDGHGLGETIGLTESGTVAVKGRVVGRDDFGLVEVVVNGDVVAEVNVVSRDGFYEAVIEEAIAIEEAGWVALRVPFHGGSYDKPGALSTGFNAYGKPLFGHTSPVYITMNGERAFKADAAKSLIAELEASKVLIREVGEYTNDGERAKVLALYDEAIGVLTKRD